MRKKDHTQEEIHKLFQDCIDSNNSPESIQRLNEELLWGEDEDEDEDDSDENQPHETEDADPDDWDYDSHFRIMEE